MFRIYHWPYKIIPDTSGSLESIKTHQRILLVFWREKNWKKILPIKWSILDQFGSKRCLSGRKFSAESNGGLLIFLNRHFNKKWAMANSLKKASQKMGVTSFGRPLTRMSDLKKRKLNFQHVCYRQLRLVLYLDY